MKLAKIIFGAIVAIIISLVLIYKPAHAPTDREPDTTGIVDGEYCFSRDQAATPSEPYAVQERISLSILGNSVVGEKSGTQSGPDMTNGYSGTLAGTRMDHDLKLTFSYTVEGSSNKEVELYTLVDTELRKIRYALKEEGGMLVPDLSSVPKNIIYERETCNNN